MRVRVHVRRDSGVEPGDCTWFDLGCGEMAFMVSDRAVTEVGAEALEQAWAAFIDRGVWRFGPGPGEPISTYYHHSSEDEVVRVTTRRDGLDGRRVDVHLSPAHFSELALRGIEAAARDSVGCGWRYVPIGVRPVAA